MTKRYGDKTAVDGLSFVVEPGVVTGFLGPNGAGKSTTMRVIAGLDRPTSGTVRVNGQHYPQAPAPMAELGILLDARSVHPGLSARSNLLALARTAGIGRRRVDEVIELAGLGEVAVFLVVPLVAAYLPQGIKGFVPYLPSNAGGTIWGAGKLFGGHQLSPWAEFAVLCGYAVVLTGLAAWRLRRRDA